MSIVDRLFRAVAPDFAAKRLIARMQYDLLEAQAERNKDRRGANRALASYDGATRGYRTEGRRIGTTSADREIWTSLTRLRNVHRELVRNNAYASRAISVIASNVVGAGITVSVKHKSKAKADLLNELVRKHLMTTDIDHDGRHNYYGLQNLVMRTVAQDGEALIIRRKISTAKKLGLWKKPALPFQVQVLEADYLVPWVNDGITLTDVQAGHTVIQGIEFDEHGQRVAYHLYKQHPGSLWKIFGQATVRVPAEDVIHIYRQDRPGQTRGVPWGASVIMPLWDLGDYEDAELMRQKIAACFAVFWIDGTGNLKLATDETVTRGTENLPADMLEPGMQQRLPPGSDVKFTSPPTTQGFPEYIRSMIRKIAIGYGVPYEALAGDLSQVNFSSGRMGWLEFQRTIAHWQQHMLMPHMCVGIATWFLDAAEFVVPGASAATVSHTEPRREMIDPTKEIPAIRDGIRAGLISRPDALRAMGEDPEQVDQENAEANERADKLGLKYDSDGRFPAGGGNAPASNDEPPTKPKKG